MRTATTQTRVLVRDAIAKYGGERAFVASLDPEKYDYYSILSAMSNAILDKGMSLRIENSLRLALGAEPLPALWNTKSAEYMTKFTDCTCDGEQGQAVWVHPKEKLVKAPGFGTPRKERKTIQLSPEAYAIMAEWRKRIGGDWYEDNQGNGLPCQRSYTMSLTVTLTAMRPTEVFWRNITHNLNKMAIEAGIYEYLWRPDELEITKAAELIEPLRTGLALLKSDPGRFTKLGPPNKWGNYNNLWSL